MSDLTERLRKMATSIHIAVEKEIADDIDRGLTEAADRIEAVERERDEARRATTSIADRAAITAKELRDRIEALEAARANLEHANIDLFDRLADAEAALRDASRIVNDMRGWHTIRDRADAEAIARLRSILDAGLSGTAIAESHDWTPGESVLHDAAVWLKQTGAPQALVDAVLDALARDGIRRRRETTP